MNADWFVIGLICCFVVLGAFAGISGYLRGRQRTFDLWWNIHEAMKEEKKIKKRIRKRNEKE